ncbi:MULTISPECIES: hypothetical protein [unclassified Rhizobium]|uniref:hypothetical protein n=1 Tax=unclassified Rhizobium TaxID=2613769 RepID=UPI00071435BF|nr:MULTISPECIES: hypothetical protein [unclassified Rhizobium]KQS84138.1 hypothetical protein ASG50_30080 [Rhizobium sp. Leaf386]KQT03199.1 hypothetical protein ASG42_24625 [Rhizobium sp. Leaf391]KQU08406.1 hypothetical protein ASG68_22735 [Rhizobium sp. Leaf453]
MNICRLEWLLDARDATSYRRMYGLVILIIASKSATAAERGTAEYLKELLEEVIELAIAPSASLQVIRHGFELLVNVVENEDAKVLREALGASDLQAVLSGTQAA